MVISVKERYATSHQSPDEDDAFQAARPQRSHTRVRTSRRTEARATRFEIATGEFEMSPRPEASSIDFQPSCLNISKKQTRPGPCTPDAVYVAVVLRPDESHRA